MTDVILAGIHLKNQSDEEFQAAMEECRALCEACGLQIAR
jgi:50S ribosomal subunit-associated GTPase HflX